MLQIRIGIFGLIFNRHLRIILFWLFRQPILIS